MKVRSLWPAAVAASLAAGWTAPAPALADVTLRFSHWSAPQGPVDRMVCTWIDAVQTAPRGAITNELYPGGQIGKAKNHYDMARDGIADITWPCPGFTPGRFPIIAATEAPLLVGKSEEATRVFDVWYRPYAAREVKDVHYCFALLSAPGILSARGGPVPEPGAVAARHAITPTQLALAWLLHQGESIVPIPASERREFIDQTVAATRVRLDSADLAELDAALPRGVASGPRWPEAWGRHIVPTAKAS